MDDLVRRYLRQQIELGGAEVVLTDDVQKRADTMAKTRGAPTEAPLTPGAKAVGAGATDWRIGAPPIPEAGLTIIAPVAEAGATWSNLAEVATAIEACRKCFLAEGRTKVVPGEGNPHAELVLVGEGPGQTEDQTGRPFVGRAGELLNGILAAIGYTREQVFICNVVKCRPPQNRKPLPEEMASCSPYLTAQLALIKPKVILALGATAAEALLQSKRSLSDLRLKVHSYRGTPLVVTYHPAALLRNPNWKKPTWDDVRIARQLIDRG